MLERIRKAFEILRRGGDEEVERALKEVQRALLLADVDLETVKWIREEIRKRVEGKERGVSKREVVIRELYSLLLEVLGGEKREIPVTTRKIMLVGLFGSGKTTTAGKLARYFIKRGRKVTLVCGDMERPAACEQLRTLAKRVGAGYRRWREGEGGEGMEILDTPGRPGVGEGMEEIREMKGEFSPDLTLLVIPADMGRAARGVVEGFGEVGVDGVVITKMDGSGKGGGAITACVKLGVPVYFIGTGEGMEDLEEFDPRRFLNRILGFGDIEGLLEKVKESEVSVEDILKADRFDINVFYKQIASVRKMGPLGKIMNMLGIGVGEEVIEVAEEKFKRYDAIYKSMTKQERAHPEIINASRIRRIARGSGTREEDVRAFLKDYKRAEKMWKKLKKGKGIEKMLRRFGVHVKGV